MKAGEAVSAKLHRLFRVLPEESGKLALFALFIGLLQAGVAIGMTAADSLFLTHLGADKLPYVYLLTPVIMLLYAPAYSSLLARLGIDRLVQLTLSILVLGGCAFAAADGLLPPGTAWLLYAMKFYAGLWFIALYTLFWNFADDYFSILDGKRLYGIIAGGGATGGTLGAVLVSWLSSIVPPGQMFLAWAIVAAATVPVFMLLRRRCLKIESDAQSDSAAVPSSRVLSEVFATLRGSRFALSLAAISFCGVMLTAVMEYLTLGVLSHGKSAAELARLLGQLYAIANGLTLAVSLLAFNRIVGRIGVGNTALVLPLVYLAAFAGFFLQYGFGAALVALYAYQSLLASIEYNNVNLLFNALPTSAKRPLRTFVEAMSEPLATATAGGLLLAWAVHLGHSNLALAGIFASVGALLVALVLRHDYSRALAENLRRDWLDFSPPPEHWRTWLTEADRLWLREKAFRSADRGERIAATDLLGFSGDPAAGEALARLVETARPVEAERLRPAIGRILRAGDTATVAGLLLWLEGPTSPDDPELLDEFAAAGALPVRHLPAWSRSTHPSRIAMSAVSRWHGSRIEDAESALADVRRLLAGERSDRRWGVRALGGFRHPQHASELLRLVDEPDGELRIETLRALHKVASPDTLDVIPRVVPLLTDAGPDERRLILGIIDRIGATTPIEDLLLAARDFSVLESRQLETLIAGFGPRAIAMVIHVLRNPTASSRSRIVAARTLARLARSQLDLIAAELMETELQRARDFAIAAESLRTTAGDDHNDGSVVLQRFYRDSAAEAVDFVVQLLGLTGRLPDVDLILASLAFGNPKDHANAVEAVEQSCSRLVFAQIQPLLAVTGRPAVFAAPTTFDRIERETVLRRGSVSEHPLECAAALLALRSDGVPHVLDMIRQRIDQSESARITASLVSLLPYFTGEAYGAAALHPVQRVATLARAAYFSGARIGSLEYIGARAEEHRYPDEAVLYNATRPSGNLQIVATGVVELVCGPDRRRLGPGGTCNQRALLGGGATDEAAISQGCIILSVPGSTIMRAIEIFPALGISLYRTKIVPTAKP